MRAQQTFLTREGYQKLEQEWNYLSTVRRREIAQYLHEVLPEGDILEDGELEDAYSEHAFLEGRIQALRNILASAVIIEETGSRDTVGLGSHVTVIDLAGDDVAETYRIVGSAEANPAHGSISNESPLGKALLDRKVGEEIKINVPDGEVVFKIVDIQ